MKLRILADLRKCTLALFLFVQHLSGLPTDSGMVVQSSSPVSALAVVTRSLQLAASDLQLRKNYTYQERQVEKHMDASGKIRKTIVHTYDIVIIGQTRLARLIAKNDQPLSDKEARKEEDRMLKEERKAEEHLRQPNPGGENDKEEERERGIIKYFPEVYSFSFAGDDVFDGQTVWIIRATPIASYRPRALEARLLKCLEWKLWITKSDYHLIKREGEAIDDFSLGLFLVKLHKGMRIEIEQVRINNEIWLPQLARASNIDARVAWHTERVELETTYSAYKKFRADTRVTGVPAAPPP